MKAGQSSEIPFTLQQWIPQDQYLANTRIGLIRMTKKSRDSLKRNTKNTRLTSEIPAQYLERLPFQTCARQYRLGTQACKTLLSKKADEIQSFADRKDMKKFFDALKTIYGPQDSGNTPLLSADGTSLLTDKEAIFKKWAEYFDDVLNRQSSINDEAINRLPQVEYNPLLDELPAVSETVKARKLLASGKAPGSDAIPAEIHKAGGPPVAEKLTELFHIMWRLNTNLFMSVTLTIAEYLASSRLRKFTKQPPSIELKQNCTLWLACSVL